MTSDARALNPLGSDDPPRLGSWELTSKLVPDPEGMLDRTELEGDVSLPPIWRFARTCEGERFLALDDLALLRTLVQRDFAHAGALSETLSLDALRALLYFEQNYTWRKNSAPPWDRRQPDDAAFTRALVRTIAKRLSDDEFYQDNYDTEDWQKRSRRNARTNELDEWMWTYGRTAELLAAVSASVERLAVAGAAATDDDVFAAFDEGRPGARSEMEEYESQLVTTLGRGLYAEATGTPAERVANALAVAYERAARFKA